MGDNSSKTTLDHAAVTRHEVLIHRYENMYLDAEKLNQEVLGKLKNSKTFHHTLIVLRPKSFGFIKTHRTEIFALRAEIMRHAARINQFPLVLNQEAPFSPFPFFEQIVKWLYYLMLHGTLGVCEANTLHLQTGEELIFPQPKFLSNLLEQLMLINWIGLADVEKEIYPQIHKGMKVNDKVFIKAFQMRGVTAFASTFTTCVNHILHDQIKTPFTRKELIYKLLDSDGLLGQMMRTGGELASNFGERFINPYTARFIPSAPIIYRTDGEISLDIFKARLIQSNSLVNMNIPDKVKAKGAQPCPASQMFILSDVEGVGEQEMILLWMFRQIINQMPELQRSEILRQ